MAVFEYEDEKEYYGRNGYGRQIGLEIRYYELSRDVVFSPVNTKGPSDAARIAIPFEELDTVIEELQRIKDELKSK